MKIVHISSPDFPITREYGGSESVVCNLVEKQLSEGHDVTIIAGNCKENDGTFRSISVVDCSKEYPHWLLNYASHRINGALHVYRSLKWIASKFDVIHNHLSEEGISLSFLRETPCLTSLHGAPHYRFLPYVATKLFSITCDTKLVALSRFSYLSFKRFYGDDLIGYIHTGVNTDVIKFVKNVQKTHDVEVCFAGRIAPEKSVKEVINVVKLLHNRGVDIHLNLIGKFDPRNPSYFVDVVNMANTHRKFITPNFNAPSCLLRELVGNSDIFIFPITRNDNFPLAPIEALASGTPVAVLNNGAAAEFVKDGVTGFVCSSMVDMSNRLLKYIELDREVCRQTVETEFSINTMYHKYLKAYNRVIAQDKTV
jgi:glycosyltransferase involved in cell wall biosynthesis